MAGFERLELPTGRIVAGIEGGIGWLALNNPARRNALSLAMWEAIPLALERFAAEARVRVIVLRGEGEKAFAAGADISEFEQRRASADGIARYDAALAEASARLESMEKPTIAMIRGYCVGGGVGLAACCDLRLAAEDARFAIPAARLGLGYGVEGVRRLLGLVGPAMVREIFYTARQFSAAEMLAMGFLSRVVAVADLEAETRALTATIAENAPLTLKALKRTVAELGKTEPDLAVCEALVAECSASADYVEGRRAFMEKRKPVFRGR